MQEDGVEAQKGGAQQGALRGHTQLPGNAVEGEEGSQGKEQSGVGEGSEAEAEQLSPGGTPQGQPYQARLRSGVYVELPRE